MAVARSNITNQVSATYRQLEILKSKIGDELSYVNEEELKTVIHSLEHEVNLLAQQIHQSVKIDPVEATLKKNLLALVKDIQKNPAFSQAIGALSQELMKCLNRIRNNMSQFENKVSKVENDRSR